MKASWKDAPLLHKVVTIISVLASLSVVVLAVLQIFDVWEQAINIMKQAIRCVKTLFSNLNYRKTYGRWAGNLPAVFNTINLDEKGAKS